MFDTYAMRKGETVDSLRFMNGGGQRLLADRTVGSYHIMDDDQIDVVPKQVLIE